MHWHLFDSSITVIICVELWRYLQTKDVQNRAMNSRSWGLRFAARLDVSVGENHAKFIYSRPHLEISRLFLSSSHQGAELRFMTVNSDQLLTSLIGRWVAELPVRLNHCLVNFKVFCNVTRWQYWLGNGNFNEYFYRLKSPKRAFVLSLVND